MSQDKRGQRRLDALTPYVPPDAREKLDALRPQIIAAFMEGREADFNKYTQEAALILRLAGIKSAVESRQDSGTNKWLDFVKRTGGKRKYKRRKKRS